MSVLEPPLDAQRSMLNDVVELAVERSATAGDVRITPSMTAHDVRMRLSELDPDAPMDPTELTSWAAELLDGSMVHATSPRYFGLFNPTPSFMGIVGDLMTAVYNPQLAAWNHAPGPVEIEAWLIRYFAGRIGFTGEIGGSFTSGGAEANAMAVHVALTRTFPDFGDRGLRSLDADPVIYISTESHHAWLKIAHVTGIGRSSVRHIPVTGDFKLDPAALRAALAEDARTGKRPTLVVATAGTTSAGVIDDLHEIGRVATDYDAFFHIDAAWGGAAVLSDTLGSHLDGIETADSVTIDAHKWLSVPMGAGMFITPHPELLSETYRVSTAYMPDAEADTVDPYTTTNQWSRRFTGLKLFLSLVTAGRTGYERQLDHDARLGDRLRERLTGDGWEIINDTPLPVVCFVDRANPSSSGHHQQIVDRVVGTGRAWISITTIEDRPTIRACITSHRTTEADIDELVDLLHHARA